MSGVAATAGTLRPRHRHVSQAQRRRWALWGSYAALTVFVFAFLVPPYYTIVTSLKTSGEISAQHGSPWYPHRATLSNYIELITNHNFQMYYWNTIKVTIAVVAVTLVMSVLAAFSLARMRFWGSQGLATGVFLTYLVPPALLFLPLFKVVGGVGLLNNAWSLVLTLPTLSVPFCTWCMIGYFASIPKELDEAALIDGAGYLQVLTRIFIPVALPGIIAATIFCFTVSWANFLYGLAFTTSADQLTLPVGIVTTLIRGDVYAWGQIMTGALLGAAPPLIIYAFLMDYYISGLTAGATKG